VDDDIRARIEKRFEKVGRQVSESASLEVELSEEKNPSIHDSQVAEGNLRVKGATLRAREAADNMSHAIHLMADDLARQIKKHNDKRRSHRGASRPEAPAAP
jgi:putative sigma-54 modulation protein